MTSLPGYDAGRKGPITFSVGGISFVAQEIHHRAPRSWNRQRKHLRFDGFELTCPGASMLIERAATLDGARELAASFVARWSEESREQVLANQAARAALADAVTP